MHENIVRIKVVAECLKGIEQPYVFVGGATVSLYSTEADLATDIRPTDDVDVVIELASYTDHAQFEARLRSLGFMNDLDSRVICRYVIKGIIVDIMPTSPDILGFSNKWYPEGFRNAVPVLLDENTTVLIFSLPYFLASKWEAFKSRGEDLRTSRDFEDMVYIFENCRDFDDQLSNGPKSVREFLASELAPLLDEPEFEEGLYSHIVSTRSGASAGKLIAKIKYGLKLQ